MQKKKLNIKIGAALMETMLVLSIIGIVFILCIGVFFADLKKNQTAVKIKSVYSLLTQAFNASIAKNGSPYDWDVSDNFSETVSNDVFESYLKPQLIILKDCKNSTSEKCDFSFKELNGDEKSLNSTWTRFYLNNGMFIAMQAMVNPMYKVLYFYVDTNGKKHLNVVARDIFMFEYWIQNDENPSYVGRFFPYGHEYSRKELISDNNENNCNSTKNGNYCSSLIFQDDWKIKLEYPWAKARYGVK